MHSPDERVVVTGLGMVTPFGIGHDAFWNGVLEGRSAARLIPGLDPARYPTPFACPVDDASLDVGASLTNRKSIKLMSRATRFAMVAARLAFEDPTPPLAARGPLRCGVVHRAGGLGLHGLAYLATTSALAADSRVRTVRTRRHPARVPRNHLAPLQLPPTHTRAHASPPPTPPARR